MIPGLLIVCSTILFSPCYIVNSGAFDFCSEECETLKTWVHFEAFTVQFKERVRSEFDFLCMLLVRRNNSHAAVFHVICKTVSFLENMSSALF